jgi:hypothetical protein
MSNVGKSEIMERFVDGLKVAADRARSLHRLVGNKFWLQIADSLDRMRLNGTQMVDEKALTYMEALEKFDQLNGTTPN